MAPRTVSTRKTRSARKAEEAAIQVAMHKSEEVDTFEPVGKRSTRSGRKGGKSTGKKSAASKK